MFQFLELDVLTDGEINLRIHKKVEANDAKGYVPAYHYHMTLPGSIEPIGEIDLRIGNTEGLYYGGHIGYQVYEAYRGHHYAYKACRLIKQVALGHGMQQLYITCNPDNIASKRTIERLGAKLKGIVDLPSHNDMYQDGERQKCIFIWDLL
jgi:predicted acetyltransferase